MTVIEGCNSVPTMKTNERGARCKKIMKFQVSGKNFPKIGGSASAAESEEAPLSKGWEFRRTKLSPPAS
jgi:hypothetical protein